jgi:site-specific DNA-methyltransferase (adenine-specific)
MIQVNYNPDVLTCLANLSNDEVFTPPILVNDMLDLLPQELWSNPNAKFLDPVSKTGVFLREMAKRLMKGLETHIPDKQERINHIFSKQLYGIAITELTSLLSRRSVYCSKTANGKYSICDTFTTEQGNIYYDRLRHTWQNGKCYYCGASQEVYDRDDALETYAYNFIHTDNPDKIFNMKFDVIVGNPPYQLTVGVDKENYAIALYQKFVEQSMKLKPRFLSMIIPSRWFTGGRGLDEFRKTMLNDKRLKVIVDFTDSRDCFPGVDIAGGVCYFLWDLGYTGECVFTNITNGKSKTTIRKLNEFEIFPRYNDSLSIISKVLSRKENLLSNFISVQTPFGFHTSYRGNPKANKDIVNVLTSRGWVKCEKEEVSKGQDIIDKYKVIFTAATTEHGGQANKSGLRKVMSSLKVLDPNSICTQSYLVGGSFETIEEANNQISYFSTRFVRFLLFQAITSQHISRDKFCFVPTQDFTEPWNDDKLYKKYGLTNDEIAFIESMIRPMDKNNNESEDE